MYQHYGGCLFDQRANKGIQRYPTYSVCPDHCTAAAACTLRAAMFIRAAVCAALPGWAWYVGTWNHCWVQRYLKKKHLIWVDYGFLFLILDLKLCILLMLVRVRCWYSLTEGFGLSLNLLTKQAKSNLQPHMMTEKVLVTSLAESLTFRSFNLKLSYDCLKQLTLLCRFWKSQNR